MPDSRRILILGGTGEARALAAALATHPALTAVTSLAGRTAAPVRPAGELRVGGFGGSEGLADYLDEARIAAVVDATHPYAAAISRHAVEACRLAGRPLLRLERPPWQPQPGDRWVEVDSLQAAAAVAPGRGRRAFLAIGAKGIEAFAGVREMWFLLRLVDRPAAPPPLADCEILLARGPFDAAAETALLRRHRIDVVIAKNSGGEAAYGKIAAARALGLPVLLLRRPDLPSAETVQSVDQVIAWIDLHPATRA